MLSIPLMRVDSFLALTDYKLTIVYSSRQATGS